MYAYSLKSKFKSVFEGTYIIEGLELNSVEMNLNKGKTGEYPMFFIEYNRQVALSMNDTLTFGEIYKIDNIWYASFNFPNTDQYARVKINEQELSGRLFSKTNNKPLDSIRIKINRMPETQNYLNRR
ncbi:hypothetical protein KUL113_48480 [Tenacibaculum sp. KUL113]|nr:hypothetical protein KUL113_48480 [Tenacibaculum sp. KUL113]